MAGKSESAVRELHRVYLKLEQLDLLAADIVMPDPKLPDIDKPRLLTERPALCALASDLGEMCATKNVTRIMRGIETGTETIPQLWESLLMVQVQAKALPQELNRKPLRRHDVAGLLLSVQHAFEVVEGWYDILKSRLSPDEQERIESGSAPAAGAASGAQEVDEGPPDELLAELSDYVEASKLQRQHDKRFKTYKQFKGFLDKHADEIRIRKPSKQRLLVHVADLSRSLAEESEQAFNALAANANVVDAFLKESKEREQAIPRRKNRGK